MGCAVTTGGAGDTGSWQEQNKRPQDAARNAESLTAEFQPGRGRFAKGMSGVGNVTAFRGCAPAPLLLRLGPSCG